ncbi:hypothetical protein ACFE04_024821 [Oxalis oulophora]
MTVSFKYWDECIDPLDMEAMWEDSEVCAEWLNAGEVKGEKVHLSRDPDGHPYLTQTEMKAVAEIVVSRHFGLHIDPVMICCIAELESDRRPFLTQYDKKSKETTIGIMQLLPKTADLLISEGYRTYNVEGDPDMLYRPFVNVYFGAAYLKYLSQFEGEDRSEEFVVRLYKGGTKKGAKRATHKSTLQYWKRYVSVKESIPSRNDGPLTNDVTSPPSGTNAMHWDFRVSPEDMDEMWKRPDVAREWHKSGEKKGQVCFLKDKKRRSYLSRVQLKAVADIILSKHFSTKGTKPIILCALAEVVSARLVNGSGEKTGIMGIDYHTAFRLYTELGYRAYKVDSNDDLIRPFVSMYFGAAYMTWLLEYEGSEQTTQFAVQAYILGPDNVKQPEAGPVWQRFEQALISFEEAKKDGSCTIL